MKKNDEHSSRVVGKRRAAGRTGSTAPRSEAAPSLTDADVIAAIRANHLKANIGWCERKRSVTLHWDRAWVDPGGTYFGGGPYLKLPITNYWGEGEETVHRVYPPARLMRRLAKIWAGGSQAPLAGSPKEPR